MEPHYQRQFSLIYWNLNIRWFNVIYRTLIGGVLLLGRDTIGLFHNPSRLGMYLFRGKTCRTQTKQMKQEAQTINWSYFIYSKHRLITHPIKKQNNHTHHLLCASAYPDLQTLASMIYIVDYFINKINYSISSFHQTSIFIYHHFRQ